MTGYTIRPAHPRDLPHLQPIERAAASLFVEAGIGGTISVMPLADLEAACAAGGLLVAASAGAPVGFAVFSVAGAVAHLDEMDVHPDHGRRGLGTRLLHAVLDAARQRGCAAATLTTYRDLPWNRPFYERNGFETVPEEAWTPDMARHAAAEGVRPGSGRVVMVADLCATPRGGGRQRPAAAGPSG